jgi:hypothetical protein
MQRGVVDFSLPRESFSFSKSLASAGKSEQNTIGIGGFESRQFFGARFFIVGDRIAHLRIGISLIAAVMKPISPGPRSSRMTFFGVNIPTRSISRTAPVLHEPDFLALAQYPSTTRTRMTTPR